MLARQSPTTSDEDSDSDLLQAIAALDSRAFDALFLRYYERLRRFVWRFCAEDAVDEVISDTMYTVWQKARAYRGDSKVSTWIYGIAYRIAIKNQSRRIRYREILDSAALQSDQASPDAAAPTERMELAQWIERALDALPRKQRDVVELTFFAELPYPEIAAILGCPVGTVKTRMHKARQRLRPVLQALSAGERELHP